MISTTALPISTNWTIDDPVEPDELTNDATLERLAHALGSRSFSTLIPATDMIGHLVTRLCQQAGDDGLADLSDPGQTLAVSLRLVGRLARQQPGMTSPLIGPALDWLALPAV